MVRIHPGQPHSRRPDPTDRAFFVCGHRCPACPDTAGSAAAFAEDRPPFGTQSCPHAAGGAAPSTCRYRLPSRRTPCHRHRAAAVATSRWSHCHLAPLRTRHHAAEIRRQTGRPRPRATESMLAACQRRASGMPSHFDTGPGAFPPLPRRTKRRGSMASTQLRDAARCKRSGTRKRASSPCPAARRCRVSSRPPIRSRPRGGPDLLDPRGDRNCMASHPIRETPQSTAIPTAVNEHRVHARRCAHAVDPGPGRSSHSMQTRCGPGPWRFARNHSDHMASSPTCATPRDAAIPASGNEGRTASGRCTRGPARREAPPSHDVAGPWQRLAASRAGTVARLHQAHQAHQAMRQQAWARIGIAGRSRPAPARATTRRVSRHRPVSPGHKRRKPGRSRAFAYTCRRPGPPDRVRISAWRTGSRGGPCAGRPSCARPRARRGS